MSTLEPELETTTLEIEGEQVDITTFPTVEDSTTEGSGAGEIQDDGGVSGDYDDTPTEETTTVTSLVSGALESVTSTISSIFGSPDVTETVGDAETEKSPSADQEPGISIPDINVDSIAPEEPSEDSADNKVDDITNNGETEGEEFKEDEVIQEEIVPTNDAEETDKTGSQDDAISTTESVQADSITTEVPTDILTTTVAAQDDDVPSDENEITTEADQDVAPTTETPAGDAETDGSSDTTDAPLETTMTIEFDTTTSSGEEETSTNTETVEIDISTESVLRRLVDEATSLNPGVRRISGTASMGT